MTITRHTVARRHAPMHSCRSRHRQVGFPENWRSAPAPATPPTIWFQRARLAVPAAGLSIDAGEFRLRGSIHLACVVTRVAGCLSLLNAPAAPSGP
jgi:hypothetical protein